MKCPWSTTHPLLEEYHDNEWGTPIHNDIRHFEFFTMDLFQAGLSWLTILKKREGFRDALDGFDFRKIVHYDEAKIQELLGNEKIIRNQLKIRATINNAQKFLEVIDEFGSFDNYIWQFTEGKTIHNSFSGQNQLPPSTGISDIVSKDLKKRGFKFVGTTIIYAYMQAAGMVNDHISSCFRYSELL
ncbi:MAG TPA: DNA-3-methyladenine glycosylase I [Bacteroides sp.]|nr:DNA-3-methyladenine glycosylase I [Bacteroides sp.]